MNEALRRTLKQLGLLRAPAKAGDSPSRKLPATASVTASSWS